MQKENKKITSLQALRALAFLGIFLSHAGVNVSWPSLGVAVFFVLSGFLLMYQGGERELACGLKENALFSWNKIKKLYPLHILTMFAAAFLDFAFRYWRGFTRRDALYLVGCTGLNVTLLQSWVPYSPINVSFNGVAWYLSVMLFLYFMYPYLKKHIATGKKAMLLAICGGILVLEILVCLPFIQYFGIASPVYIWFMYCFPVFRLGDFYIGCVFGRIYRETLQERKLHPALATAAELVTFALTVLLLIWIRKHPENLVLKATQNSTTLYIPLAVLWILLFSYKTGLLTWLLTNPVTVFLGNISAYTFLIHYVFTRYFTFSIAFFEIPLTKWQNVLVILTEFVLTVLSALLYRWAERKILQAKKNRAAEKEKQPE